VKEYDKNDSTAAAADDDDDSEKFMLTLSTVI